jgi:NTE family protein
VEEWGERFRAGASQLLDRELVRSVLQRFGSGSRAGPEEIPEVPVVAPEDPFDALPAGLGKFDMMNRSLEAMQSVLIRYRTAGYPPDVLVQVPRDACRSLDFHRAGEMIELGRSLTEEALDRVGLSA